MSTKNCQIRPPSSKCLLLPKVDTSSRAALAGASIPWCFVVFYPNHETRTLHQGMAAFEHENSFHRNLLKSGFANSLSSSKEKGVTIFACSSWWKEMGGKSWLPPVPFGRHLSSRMTYGKPPRLHLFEWSHHTDLGKWRALRKGFFEENHSWNRNGKRDKLSWSKCNKTPWGFFVHFAWRYLHPQHLGDRDVPSCRKPGQFGLTTSKVEGRNEKHHPTQGSKRFNWVAMTTQFP